MSNTNGYLPRSLLDELDKKEKKPTAPVKAAKKNSKETYNATSTEAVTAKKKRGGARRRRFVDGFHRAKGDEKR